MAIQRDSEDSDTNLALLLLNDFEKQYFPLPLQVKVSLCSSWVRLYLLLWLDWFLCILIFGPLGLAWWRGAWGVSDLINDHIICSDNMVKATSIYLGVGLVGVTICEVWHHKVRRFAGPAGTVRHTFIARVFSLVWGFLDLLLWKGVWDGYLLFVNSRWHLGVITVGLSLAVLTLTRTCRTSISFPIGTSVDHPSLHITAKTLLRSREIDSLALRLVDSLLSRGIEMTAVVLWKSLWLLEDTFLTADYIDNPFLLPYLDLICLLTGLFLSLIVFLLQFPLLRLWSRHGTGFRTLAANWLFCQVATVSTVSSWRAGWNLVDRFYLPHDRVASLVTCLLFGAGGLLLMNCATLLHPGIGRDQLDKEGVMLGFYYTSYFFIRERTQGNREQVTVGDGRVSRRDMTEEREALVGATSEEE